MLNRRGNEIKGLVRQKPIDKKREYYGDAMQNEEIDAEEFNIEGFYTKTYEMPSFTGVGTYYFNFKPPKKARMILCTLSMSTWRENYVEIYANEETTETLIAKIGGLPAGATYTTSLDVDKLLDEILDEGTILIKIGVVTAMVGGEYLRFVGESLQTN